MNMPVERQAYAAGEYEKVRQILFYKIQMLKQLALSGDREAERAIATPSSRFEITKSVLRDFLANEEMLKPATPEQARQKKVATRHVSKMISNNLYKLFGDAEEYLDSVSEEDAPSTPPDHPLGTGVSKNRKVKYEEIQVEPKTSGKDPSSGDRIRSSAVEVVPLPPPLPAVKEPDDEEETQIVKVPVLNPSPQPGNPEKSQEKALDLHVDADRKKRLSDSKTSTDPDILRKLSLNDSYFIKMNVVKNRATPIDVIERLTRDRLESVAGEALLRWHEAMGKDLSKIDHFHQHENSTIRSNVAKKSSDPAILRKLAEDTDIFVRWSVARNPATPIDVIERLTRARDESVARFAKENLAKRK
jgi:hypothetical protein